MCLSKATKVNMKPVEKTFYKVFSVNRGTLYNLSFNFYKPHYVGEKYKESYKFKIGIPGIRKGYTSGFHGFATKIGAEAWKSRVWTVEPRSKQKVFKCRGLVRTEGCQHCNSKVRKYKSFVADTMEIIGEV